jgi:methylenetetrahydrofolate--tRNA-(uracil-5-)-methyltransferase
VESAAVGLLAGRFAVAERLGRFIAPPPATTAHGALLAYITGGHVEDGSPAGSAGTRSYQPMNVNFGLFPPLAHAIKGEGGQRLRGGEKALAKKRALAARALADLARWSAGDDHAVAAE